MQRVISNALTQYIGSLENIEDFSEETAANYIHRDIKAWRSCTIQHFYHTAEELSNIMLLSDAIEVSPVREEDGACEVCSPDEAHFYSVYAHYKEGGVECIADFKTQRDARRYAQRFGLPIFTGA